MFPECPEQACMPHVKHLNAGSVLPNLESFTLFIAMLTEPLDSVTTAALLSRMSLSGNTNSLIDVKASLMVKK
jgi:hypothetical protein